MDEDQLAAITDVDLLLETMVSAEGVRSRDEALQLLCEKTSEVIGSAATMLRLVDLGDNALHTVALANTAGALTPHHVEVARTEVLPLGRLNTHIVRRGSLPPSVEAFLTGEIQVVASHTGTEFPLASMCTVPLVRRGRSLGVLALYWAHEHEPDDRERRVIRIAARIAGLVVEVTESADRAQAELRRNTSARRQALQVLMQANAAPSAVRRAETVLELEAAGPHMLLVAEFADAEQAYAYTESSADETFLSDAAIVASGVHALVLLPGASVIGRVRARLVNAPGYLGAGSAGPVRPGAFARVQQDATTAAHISRARGGRLVAYDEMGSVLSATAGMPEHDARALIAELLGPLEEYDERHESRLLDTLVAYLSENGSTTATARRLHLHVNTVKQRIERINELTGGDVRDYTFVARLLLALEWRSLLGE